MSEPDYGDEVPLIGLLNTSLLQPGEVGSFEWSVYYERLVSFGYVAIYTGPIVPPPRPPSFSDASVAGFVAGASAATRAAVEARVRAVGDATYAPTTDPRLRKVAYDLREFGTGVGVGSESADTAAMDAAWAFISSKAQAGVVTSSPSDQYDISQSVLLLPPGTVRYAGTGFTDTSAPDFSGRFSVRGSHQGASEIRLADGVRLFDFGTAPLTRFELSDFQVRGGIGLFRHMRTSDNVFGDMAFRRLVLRSYSGCAIEYNSQNMPYVLIEQNVFRAKDTLASIGIALSGIANGSRIQGNRFLLNRVHLKMQRGGNDVYVNENDFLRFSTDRTNGPCVDIWMVPSPDYGGLGAGAGTHITRSNKLGNENFQTGDFKILAADEAAGGTSNGDKFPAATTQSSGYIEGINVYPAIYGASTAVRSPIFSTTYNVQGCDIAITQRGHSSLPDYVLEFLNPTSAPLDPRRDTNRISMVGAGVGHDKLVRPTNLLSHGQVVDPGGQLAGARNASVFLGGSGWGDYKNIINSTTGINGYVSSNGATKTGAADSFGANNESIEVTFVAGGLITGSLASGAMIPGRRCWIDGMVRQTSADAITKLGVRVQDGSSNVYFQRIIEVPIDSGFLRPSGFRFSFVPPVAGGSVVFFVADNAELTGAGGTGKVRIERVKVYQSSEPVQSHPRMEPLELVAGLKLREGTNARMGVSTLVAGTVTVANTSVASNSRIILTPQNDVAGALGVPAVTARTAGTSFTITAKGSDGSTVTNDTRQIAWVILDPML